MTKKTLLSNIDIESIIEKYKTGKFSMKTLGKIYHTSHHRIRVLLVENGVEILSKKRNIFKNLDDLPILYMSKIRKYKRSKEALYKNMKAHLRFDVSLEWLMQFDDIDKVKILNKALTDKSDRYGTDTDWYIAYIEKFYYDRRFNLIYKNYIDGKFDPYKRPSLDHIIPKSNGGTNKLNNLQFMTWFENRAKNNISQEYWDYIVNNINEYILDYKVV